MDTLVDNFINAKQISDNQLQSRNILITSALPYINNVPHLGNIIGCVLSADIFARYCRLKVNTNVLYICGTDEYGTATEIKANEEKTTPLAICDEYYKLHAEVYDWFNISFDKFGRTTNKFQKKISQDIFFKLYEKDYIITDTVDQLFCKNCQRFLADRYVEGQCPLCGYSNARGDQCDKCGKLMNVADLVNPVCKICSQSDGLITKASEHLFLDLPKLEPIIGDWFKRTVEERSENDWTHTARVITQAWLKSGLKPRCITRDLQWGTPVPLQGFQDKVFYVWYDAPIGYLSITADFMEDWEFWWKNPKNVTLYNFMAKDNVPFHSVIFPACLLGTGENYTLVNHLIATEYLNYENQKFSKSRSVGIFGDQVKDTGIPSDIWRFYLISIRPETQDSNFSWDDLLNKNNGELLNNLGNFIHRSLSFVWTFYGGTVPEFLPQSVQPSQIDFIREIGDGLNEYISLMDHVKERDALHKVMEISRQGNLFIQSQKPWEYNKSTVAEDKLLCSNVIALVVNAVHLLAIILSPFIPDTSQKIFEQLGENECSKDGKISCNIPHSFYQYIKPGHKISKPFPLFEKLEHAQIEALKKRYAGAPPKSKPNTSDNQKTIGDQNVSKEQNIIDLVASLKLNCPLLEGSINGNSDVDNNQLKLDAINKQIVIQGDKIRTMKSEKIDKTKIQVEVTTLLNLKKLASLLLQ